MTEPTAQSPTPDAVRPAWCPYCHQETDHILGSYQHVLCLKCQRQHSIRLRGPWRAWCPHCQKETLHDRPPTGIGHATTRNTANPIPNVIPEAEVLESRDAHVLCLACRYLHSDESKRSN